MLLFDYVALLLATQFFWAEGIEFGNGETLDIFFLDLGIYDP